MENLLVTIATFTKSHIGCFVKEKLENSGIECFITDEGFKTSGEDLPDGMLMKVRASDTEKAIEALIKLHKEYDLNKLSVEDSFHEVKKILVPVDLSEYSMNACKHALGIAEKINAELKLLYIYEDPNLAGPQKHTTSWEAHVRLKGSEEYKNAQARLLRFSDEIKEHIPGEKLKSARLHYTLLKGWPETIIAAESARYKPEMIVMGPKGKHEKKSSYIGSVTTRVIEHTKYPVLTVPKSAGYFYDKTINIMYATDFNESDNTSLNRLLEIVAPFDTRIHCIHIDIENDPLKQGKVEELNNFLSREYKDHNIQCRIFESSNVIQGFEDFVERYDIDLISFSSPRRTLFYKIFHPNKLKKMVSTSKIPMLIFPV